MIWNRKNIILSLFTGILLISATVAGVFFNTNSQQFSGNAFRQMGITADTENTGATPSGYYASIDFVNTRNDAALPENTEVNISEDRSTGEIINVNYNSENLGTVSTIPIHIEVSARFEANSCKIGEQGKRLILNTVRINPSQLTPTYFKYDYPVNSLEEGTNTLEVKCQDSLGNNIPTTTPSIHTFVKETKLTAPTTPNSGIDQNQTYTTDSAIQQGTINFSNEDPVPTPEPEETGPLEIFNLKVYNQSGTESGTPTFNIARGANSAPVTFTTNKAAHCKVQTTGIFRYSGISLTENLATSSNNTDHQTRVQNLNDGENIYYIQCKNKTSNEYTPTKLINIVADFSRTTSTTPPVEPEETEPFEVTDIRVNGILTGGMTAVPTFNLTEEKSSGSVTFRTNKAAVCAIQKNTTFTFDERTNFTTTTDNLNHQETINGLANGTNSLNIKCKETTSTLTSETVAFDIITSLSTPTDETTSTPSIGNPLSGTNTSLNPGSISTTNIRQDANTTTTTNINNTTINTDGSSVVPGTVTPPATEPEEPVDPIPVGPNVITVTNATPNLTGGNLNTVRQSYKIQLTTSQNSVCKVKAGTDNFKIIDSHQISRFLTEDGLNHTVSVPLNHSQESATANPFLIKCFNPETKIEATYNLTINVSQQQNIFVPTLAETAVIDQTVPIQINFEAGQSVPYTYVAIKSGPNDQAGILTASCDPTFESAAIRNICERLGLESSRITGPQTVNYNWNTANPINTDDLTAGEYTLEFYAINADGFVETETKQITLTNPDGTVPEIGEGEDEGDTGTGTGDGETPGSNPDSTDPTNTDAPTITIPSITLPNPFPETPGGSIQVVNSGPYTITNLTTNLNSVCRVRNNSNDATSFWTVFTDPTSTIMTSTDGLNHSFTITDLASYRETARANNYTIKCQNTNPGGQTATYTLQIRVPMSESGTSIGDPEDPTDDEAAASGGTGTGDETGAGTDGGTGTGGGTDTTPGGGTGTETPPIPAPIFTVELASTGTIGQSIPIKMTYGPYKIPFSYIEIQTAPQSQTGLIGLVCDQESTATGVADTCKRLNVNTDTISGPASATTNWDTTRAYNSRNLTAGAYTIKFAAQTETGAQLIETKTITLTASATAGTGSGTAGTGSGSNGGGGGNSGSRNTQNRQQTPSRPQTPLRASADTDKTCTDYFIDMTESDPDCQRVTVLRELGYFLGQETPQGRKANLNQGLIRAELFAITSRLAGKSNTSVSNFNSLLKYKDLNASIVNQSANSWWLTAVAQLDGIVRGYGDGTLKILGNTTQTEIGKVTAEGLVKGFRNDDTKNPWYTDTVNIFKDNNMTLNPTNSATRRDAVRIMYQGLQFATNTPTTSNTRTNSNFYANY